MKIFIIAVMAFATLATACPYDLTSQEPSPLTGLLALTAGPGKL
ncbi:MULTISPECIES: hypothetical protein [Brucella/Ochrobactrum group]|uniref:Lipoprotein n=1 Tax=Brucella pecoris TaxID=867683 RepID=A0AB34Z0L4_9HYPH|nr:MULTISPECIES: hypothetical protein [Brucella/Ochrobactrum group]MBB4096424.1 hypothetical protein [Brucella pecoris]MDG9793828.1 hypothetical protein [Brucella anthropi]MDH0583696.1 hypothetical protein [Brucella anthropi]MDH0820224.1 hypothetical protein [Brucella anthropi]MDH2087071.1 hypothetical protein [Brucella anthropi]